MKIFTTRLNKELKQQGITMYRIAIDCNLSKQTVCNWCDGTSEPKAEQIAKICKYLDVSADYLLGLSDI